MEFAQQAPADRRVTADHRGLLRIEFEYDPRLVTLVRGLPNRRWNSEEKHWTVPMEHVVAVVELLRGEGFTFDRETLDLYEARRDPAVQHLTVSQLNLQVRKAVLDAFPSSVWVVGEISGFNKNAHKKWVDFHLLERGSTGIVVARVDAVLFAEDRQRVVDQLRREGDPFRLEDEVQVRVLVQVDLRAESGQYRVLVKEIDPLYTLGEVARRREEILRKLTAEGILERNRVLPFPELPLRVGLVTSLGSDAYHDVLRTLRESGFAFQVVVHGARVQGPSTETSVLNALDWFRDRAAEFDVVLICRGGGSRTDLAWFDSEALGRAVALFPLPVVVGIGHEEDRCVLDEVGWRQKTPTAAAQFLVERVQEARDRVEGTVALILARAGARVGEEGEGHRARARRLARAARVHVGHEARELLHRAERLRRGVRGQLQAAHQTEDRFRIALGRATTAYLGRVDAHLAAVTDRVSRGARRDLAAAHQRITKAAPLVGTRSRRQIGRARERLEGQTKRLHAIDPQRVVERGYAIVRSAAGNVVTDVAQAPPETMLRVQLKRGVLRARSEGEEGGG
ncbi:exodeoxyribonuclease VII large subunit [Candidatus Bipolaricaulota bacterium]|nr:exodeoxyribonuclease VII large subunit [Candidatus Bipolaricaulota bacterium]